MPANGLVQSNYATRQSPHHQAEVHFKFLSTSKLLSSFHQFKTKVTFSYQKKKKRFCFWEAKPNSFPFKKSDANPWIISLCNMRLYQHTIYCNSAQYLHAYANNNLIENNIDRWLSWIQSFQIGSPQSNWINSQWNTHIIFHHSDFTSKHTNYCDQLVIQFDQLLQRLSRINSLNMNMFKQMRCA